MRALPASSLAAGAAGFSVAAAGFGAPAANADVGAAALTGFGLFSKTNFAFVAATGFMTGGARRRGGRVGGRDREGLAPCRTRGRLDNGGGRLHARGGDLDTRRGRDDGGRGEFRAQQFGGREGGLDLRPLDARRGSLDLRRLD